MKRPFHEHPLVSSLRARGLYDLVERHAKAHYLTVAALCSPRKTPDICKARREVWRELRATTGMSTTELGEIFGRDHTTVIHSLRRKPPLAKATLDESDLFRLLKAVVKP